MSDGVTASASAGAVSDSREPDSRSLATASRREVAYLAHGVVDSVEGVPYSARGEDDSLDGEAHSLRGEDDSVYGEADSLHGVDDSDGVTPRGHEAEALSFKKDPSRPT